MRRLCTAQNRIEENIIITITIIGNSRFNITYIYHLSTINHRYKIYIHKIISIGAIYYIGKYCILTSSLHYT